MPAVIDKVAWLTYGDRHRTSPVDRIIFDHLYVAGRLTLRQMVAGVAPRESV